jgi:2-polyprenyl-3-methyl-5-hydroxy-6-metoxy-1,4-benzoquinol methylase
MKKDIITYYSERAREFEKIYDKPERQEDLARLTETLQEIFSGVELFEAACGTGYWTERIAKTAKSIRATDINESVLEIAKSKTYSSAKVTFGIADIFHLRGKMKYDGFFGGFIWSHVKLQNLERFLKSVKDRVVPGGIITFCDNNFVEGSSSPVSFADEKGNTYQTRELENGSVYQIVKNFPGEDFIRSVLKVKTEDIQFINLKYYWILKFKNSGTE